ncbi:SURF1 family protein [Shimia ponticola]|uniref:SURF1 family protein n=1 Tax=Shimia ponticola TaxID=2582893 RepID=UPI0011BE95AD|nr:SURF1 family protein [Shimia ponticola]
MRIFVLLIGVLGTGVLLWLGIWQMQRLEWKEGVLAEIEARITAAPVAVPQTPDPEADRYLPVAADGTLVGPEVHVLVSTKLRGAGYRIIQAFETDGRRMLVDRGYVDVEDKTKARTAGPVSVVGNLHWPDEIDSFTPDNDIAANTWFARDVPSLAAHLNTEPVMIIARDVSPNDPSLTPLPVDTSGIPNDHLGYAVTWFGLAAVWVGMTLLFLYRGRRKPA